MRRRTLLLLLTCGRETDTLYCSSCRTSGAEPSSPTSIPRAEATTNPVCPNPPSFPSPSRIDFHARFASLAHSDLESRASTIPLLESRITALESRCHSYELERQAWDRERCALLGELETLRRVAGVERAASVGLEGKRAREGDEQGEGGEKRVKVDEEFPRVEQVE